MGWEEDLFSHSSYQSGHIEFLVGGPSQNDDIHFSKINWKSRFSVPYGYVQMMRMTVENILPDISAIYMLLNRKGINSARKSFSCIVNFPVRTCIKSTVWTGPKRHAVRSYMQPILISFPFVFTSRTEGDYFGQGICHCVMQIVSPACFLSAENSPEIARHSNAHICAGQSPARQQQIPTCTHYASSSAKPSQQKW